MGSSRHALVTVEPEVRAIADVEAFGVVIPSGSDQAELYTRHRTGAAAHRFTGPSRGVPLNFWNFAALSPSNSRKSRKNKDIHAQE